MLDHVAGHSGAGSALARLNGRCTRLYNRVWGKARPGR